MEKLPKFVISRLALRQGHEHGTDHPDPDTLTAFVEGRLSSGKRSMVLTHLSGCPTCRDVVAFASSEENSPISIMSSGVERGTPWWRWRWTAAAAVACLGAAIVLRPEFMREDSIRPRIPAPPSAPTLDVPQPITPKPQEPKKERQAKSAKAPQLPKTSAPLKWESAAPEVRIIAGAVNAPHPDLPLKRYAGEPMTSPAPPQFRSQMVAAAPLESLWSLPANSATGVIQKSEDGGKTWEAVRVDNRSRLYALSAKGTDIWVGGAEGALFHSTDNGAHWTPIVVANGKSRLTDAITRIDVHGNGVVSLKLQGGDRWSTTDNGLHWQRE